jgi:hypothetical protein
LLGTTPQDLPFVPTLFFSSTRDQRGNCTPILATMRLYSILQLAVFNCCPFTPAFTLQLMMGFKASCHLLQHCFFVRPGTSAEFVTRSLLPLCSCSAPCSLLSSTDDHLPAVRAMLGSKTSVHLLLHCIVVRPGTKMAITAQFLAPCVCTASFSWMSSRTLPISPYV